MSGYIGNIPVPQATQTRDVFTATSGQTSFATSGYTPGFLDVWLNGVKLVNGTDFTATNGSDVVLTSGAAASDIVEVLSYSTFGVNSQTFTGTTTLSGDLQATTATFSGAVTGTDATLSGGVYLGGTGPANYLDDYEEGTWTPAAGAGTITVVDTPTYTKVGRWVFLTAVVTMPSQTNSNQARITGLPFTPKQNGSNSEYGASIGEHNYGSYIEMSIHSGYPAIIFRPNGGSSASYTAVSGNNFRFSLAYLTDS